MERIAIIGCSDGGKSSLARRLGERLGLPVIHLDVLFWRPGWIESEDDPFRRRLARALAPGRWVADGNVPRLAADLHLAQAQLIVWIDQPRLLCLWRVFWRALTERGGRRADMAEGCDERIDLDFYLYVWRWNADTRPAIEAAIALHAPRTPTVRLRSDREIAAWLTSA